MRLLYLSSDPGVPVLGHKGASVHLRELAAALADAGAEVHIASPRIEPEGDVLGTSAALHPIPAVLAKMHTEATLLEAVERQTAAVRNLAEQLAVDAIYERYSLFGAAGVRAASGLGIPHALEVNAPLREEAARYRTLPHPGPASALEREVMGATRRILAVSTQLAARLAREGVSHSRIEVVPNGVESQRFGTTRRDPDRFVVGFAGSLKPWHGVETLAEAIARSPVAHLEVAGHGPLEQVLDGLPPERVTRYGTLPHSEVISLMGGWDLGLAPYADVEDFWFSPLKVLEYMAAGACPVVSDLGEAGEVLGGGERGMLIPPGDPSALAATITALARDRGRAAQLGQRARAWVARNRRWSSNAERILTTLSPQTVSEAA